MLSISPTPTSNNIRPQRTNDFTGRRNRHVLRRSVFASSKAACVMRKDVGGWAAGLLILEQVRGSLLSSFRYGLVKCWYDTRGHGILYNADSDAGFRNGGSDDMPALNGESRK